MVSFMELGKEVESDPELADFIWKNGSDALLPMNQTIERFFFTPKEPKMVLIVSSEIFLLHFSTAVQYESVNFFNLIPEGLSSKQNIFSIYCQF